MRIFLIALITAAAALALISCNGEENGNGSSTGGETPGGAASGEATPPRDEPYLPDDPALIAENNRGVGLMGRYDYTPARDIFQGLVDQRPNWLDAKVNVAIATLNRQQEGDEQEAIDILREVLATDPQHIRARYNLALLLDRAGDPDAKVHFAFVAGKDPGDPYAAYFHGTILEREGNREAALAEYERALELDPYLASAYLGAQRVLQRLGRGDEARLRLEQFQKLQKNPHGRTIKTVYTMMGPKAEAIAMDIHKPRPRPKPPGPLFTEDSPVPLLPDGQGYTWSERTGNRPHSITACDIDGSGTVDLFMPGALDHESSVNAVIMNNGDGSYGLALDHILATVTEVNCALWGDFDNDGLTDVYLCRRGMNHLWKQGEGGSWHDVTASTGTGNEEFDTVDGAFFDADHDGDLDLFCVNADGPNELLNNNLDGAFKPIASQQGIAGDGRASRQVLVADLERDRDLDIIVVNEDPPHEVYLNDRLWQYQPADGFEDFRHASFSAVAAGDTDADGALELYTLTFMGPEEDSQLRRWTERDGGEWEGLQLLNQDAWEEGDAAGAMQSPGRRPRIDLTDIDGDGKAELLITGRASPFLVVSFDEENGAEAIEHQMAPQHDVADWLPVVLDPATGPSVVGATALGDEPLVWRPGAGRFPFLAMSFTGREEQAHEMRSNASGIGTHVAARVDSRWAVTSTLRQGSGPGQSLQPLAIGLAGHDHLDYVEIVWPDGIFQSEVHGVRDNEQSPQRDFTAGHLETIEENQRQVSSCPVLFAWDGEKYAFVSDLLGVGGMGYMVAPGEYAPPRPWENFLLPEGILASRGEQYVLKLGEPMEEACYLDAAKLVAWDLPPGWRMTVDERMAVLGPEPTGEVRFYRHEVLPVRAKNDRGEDVTDLLREADLRAATVGERDHRFIGRLTQDHVLTMEFDRPLDGIPGGRRPALRDGEPLLVIDGWVEYPYSQTMFGAWQAAAEYRAPTLEARGADGEWQVLLEQFGYPAGMPRQMSVALEELPPGTTALRLTTNQEIYWDRIAVAYAEPCADAVRVELRLNMAEVRRSGFAKRTTGPQRLPQYDYSDRRPFWDTRHQRGFYTALGPAKQLVAAADGALAIFGPGEEVHLEFADVLEPVAAEWTRRFVLETVGWCKDMDLYTKDGDTIEPLPGGDGSSEVSDALHRRYNTRYEGF